jgi:lipid-A-disaccharide synthase
MAKPLKLFILAGEPSGDKIGAELVEKLRSGRELLLSGVGGEALTQKGLVSEFDMNELSVMGWADVLPRLPKLIWRARQTAKAILRTKPDVAVLVDAQVFSGIVARQVRKADPSIPILLYVAPAVWAWKPARAARLKPVFNEVLSVLPFEPEVMRRLDGPLTHYVGHPALQRLPLRDTVPERGPVLLLPGSREGELRRHLPLMRAVAERLKGNERVSGFVLPTPRHLNARVTSAVREWGVPVEVVSGEAAFADACAKAVLATAVTGTVTLELAVAGVPMVTTYLADKGQQKRWVQYKVKFAALPNAIIDRALVPEVLLVEPDAEQLVAEATHLLDDPAATQAQLAGFREIRMLMERGAPEAPLTDAAERVLAYVKREA